MNRVENKRNTEEASLLLPWYVTGKLGLDETKEVEACLTSSLSLRNELVEEKKLSKMISNDPDILELMAIATEDQRLESLLGRINNVEKESQQNVKPRSGFSFSDLFDSVSKLFIPPSFSWTGVAIAMLLLTQLVILSSILVDRSANENGAQEQMAENNDSSKGGYQLAMAPVPVTELAVRPKDADLIIQFRSNVSKAKRQAILNKISKDKWSNSEGSPNYSIILNEKYTQEFWNEMVNRLKKNKSISFVGPGPAALFKIP